MLYHSDKAHTHARPRGGFRNKMERAQGKLKGSARRTAEKTGESMTEQISECTCV